MKLNVEAIMRAIDAAASEGLGRGAAAYQRATQQVLNRKGAQPSKGMMPSSPGEPPGRRTGHLGRSIAIAKHGQLSYRVGTNLGYGRVLELGTSVALGGPIRPTKGKYLVIPLIPKAARALAGAGSGGLRAIMRADHNFEFLRTRANKLYVVKTGYQRTELWFALQRSVTIAPRPFLRTAWRESKDAIMATARQHMSKVLPAMLRRELGVVK